MDLYRDLILDHYKHPHNFGHLSKPDVVAEEGNVTCGDRINIEIKFKQSKSTIEIADICFFGQGCAISLASASLLTEKVKGMSIKKILNLTTADILKLLKTDLTPSRTRCAVLSLEVVQKAINSDLQKK